MMSPDKKPITLRLDKRLDDEIARQARMYGISKNSYLLLLIHKGMKSA